MSPDRLLTIFLAGLRRLYLRRCVGGVAGLIALCITAVTEFVAAKADEARKELMARHNRPFRPSNMSDDFVTQDSAGYFVTQDSRFVDRVMMMRRTGCLA